MAKAIKLRQGTEDEHAAFTGAMAEVTFDTTNNTVVLHDGSTPGGIQMAKLSDVPVDLTDLTDVDDNLGNLTGAAFSGTTYVVTVASGTNTYGTGNKYYITELSVASPTVSPTVTLSEGETYRFDQSDSTNTGHPLKFSTTAGGTHDSGSEYTTGVTYNGVPGQSDAYTEITVAVGAPTLYYYCENHNGMGDGQSAPIGDWSNAILAHTLDNPNPVGTSENDQFGMPAAMSSTHAIVGSYYESDANGTVWSNNSWNGTFSGKAYIYNIATGALLYTLDNPNPVGTSTDDRFGFSVAISDTYAIVGTHKEDEAGANNAGKAYIYSLSDGSLLKTLDNRDPDGSPAGDLFGFSVAISDTYAIVGAHGEDVGSGGGAAYIYDISSLSSSGSVPAPTVIRNASTDTNAYFGWGVALSDNYVLVSAPNVNSATGQAFVFNISDGSLLYTFDNPNPDTQAAFNDKFGGTNSMYQPPTQLAISDNYAVVGVPFEEDASGDKSGKVYVFDLSDGSLAYTLDNPNPVGTSTDDNFGMAVDLDDDFVIVGAPYEDDAVSNIYPGKAYIYNLTDGSLVRTLDDPNAFGTTDGDRFGHSVGIYDSIALVSASREDDGSGTSSNSSGKAYIFNAPAAAAPAAPAGPSPMWSLSGDSTTFAAVTTSKLDTNATDYVALNHPTGRGNSWVLEDGSYAIRNNPNALNGPGGHPYKIWSTDDLSEGMTYQFYMKFAAPQPAMWEGMTGIVSGSSAAHSYSQWLTYDSATPQQLGWGSNGQYGYYTHSANGSTRLDNQGWLHFAIELQSNGRIVHYINGVVVVNEDASDLLGLTNKANTFVGSVNSWMTDIEIYTGGGIHNPDLLNNPPGFTPPTRKQI